MGKWKNGLECSVINLLWMSASITVEPQNKGHFAANSFVPCREVVPISMVSQQVSFVERLSLSQRVPYQRLHCTLSLDEVFNKHKG